MSAASNAVASTTGAQSGGQQIHLSRENLNYIALMFIVVGITFVQVIPLEIRKWFNTPLGALAGLSIVVFSYFYFNWQTALMTALLFVMVINSGLLEGAEEGFGSTGTLPQSSSAAEGFEPGFDTRLVANKKKWYVEQVLGENPLLIEENTVNTSAIQDDNSGISRSIQSGSNL
jgi:hypothetical protein